MIRRQFSPHELSVASATGYLRAIDRRQRLPVKSYAIDNHDPQKASDRDDAVYAQKIPSGYLLQVTIADVAAHIPKDSPLDKAARKRVFTVYRPPARDPMFPFVLSEDRFSLEHEQKRLGLTVTFLLDEEFRRTGLYFSRTLVEAECHDYASVSHRIIQPGDDMELLGTVAQGIKRVARPPIQPYNAGDSAYMDKTGLLRQGDAGTMAAAKLVQVLMIYANNEIANFFAAAGLPFLYRNHSDKLDENGQLTRAEYETFDNGHYGLRLSDHLQGAYSHCTSPIRRYADLVNQRMQHYTIEVVDTLAGEIAGFLPENDKRTKANLLPFLWKQAAELLGKIYAVHQARGTARLAVEKKLQHFLAAWIGQAGIVTDRQLHTDLPAHLSAAALRIAVPYTQEELFHMTPALNEAGRTESQAVNILNKRNLAKWNERVQEDLAAGNFSALAANAFSTLLRRAAITGKINEKFAFEAVARIKNERIDKVMDCYSILILNKEYQNKFWRGLKRAALNSIERDPMATNNLFDKAMREGELHADTYIAEAEIRDSSAHKRFPLLGAAGVEYHIDAALVVTTLEGLEGRGYAASSYSLGYNKKETARHARFNFLRALTFGELGPLDQTIIPTPLYAELNHDRSRMEVLQEMAKSMDLKIHELGPRKRMDGTVSFGLQVYGPGIPQTILGAVVAANEKEAEEKAATRILRQVQFKRAYAVQNPIEVGFPSNPIYVMRDLAALKGWILHEPERADIRETGKGGFVATLQLDMGEAGKIKVSQEGRNKSTTLLGCFEAMREQLQERGVWPESQHNASNSQTLHEGRWTTWSSLSKAVEEFEQG